MNLLSPEPLGGSKVQNPLSNFSVFLFGFLQACNTITAYFLNFPGVVSLSYLHLDFLFPFPLSSISCSISIPLQDGSPPHESLSCKGALESQIWVHEHHFLPFQNLSRNPSILPSPSFTHCSQIDRIPFPVTTCWVFGVLLIQDLQVSIASSISFHTDRFLRLSEVCSYLLVLWDLWEIPYHLVFLWILSMSFISFTHFYVWIRGESSTTPKAAAIL